MVFPPRRNAPVNKITGAPSPLYPVPVTSSGGICKCLFGRPGPDQTNDIKKMAMDIMAKEQRRFKRKWNFDASVSSDEEDSASSDDKKATSPPQTPPPVTEEAVSNNLAQVVAHYKWEKVENENLPYFYYKPYNGSTAAAAINSIKMNGSSVERMRPLTCRNTGEQVPTTPVKRRYKETEAYQARVRTNGSGDAKKSVQVVVDAQLHRGSPAARRLDFSDIATAKVRARQTLLKLRTSTNGATAAAAPPAPTAATKKVVATKKTTAAQARKQQDKKSAAEKKVTASPKSQKLITEMMFVRKRSTSSSTASSGKEESNAVADEKTATSSSSNNKKNGTTSGSSSTSTPFGSPVTRRVSSSQ